MPLKLQYASDLHLEFPANKDFLKQHPLQPVGEVLVLAGDIMPFGMIDKHKDFFDFLSDHFTTTYWLPGNHEYYHTDAAMKTGVLHEKIRSNVCLVNNTSMVHENTRLIFSTLWSKISPAFEWQIERNMTDFRVIKYGGYRFSAVQYNQLHTDCLLFLNNAINENKEAKTMVFTHHVPTFFNYPEQYKGDALNEAFAVELYDLIADSGIDCWIYGHHHSNIPEFNIGKTRMLTNQLGYVQYGEHMNFARDNIVEMHQNKTGIKVTD